MFPKKLLALSMAGSAVLLVAGCGGGYDKETLYVSVYFPTASISLYNTSTIVGQQSGFDGHDAHCGMTSGQMAPGMHLNWDCTITGTPTAAGSYYFNYVISAEDTEGEVSSSGSVNVIAPGVSYSRPAMKVGTAASDAPTITGGWKTPAASAVPTWSYALAGGTLASGLALNPTTGVVSGTPTIAGNYSAQIKATLTTTFGSYSPANVNYVTTVSP